MPAANTSLPLAPATATSSAVTLDVIGLHVLPFQTEISPAPVLPSTPPTTNTCVASLPHAAFRIGWLMVVTWVQAWPSVEWRKEPLPVAHRSFGPDPHSDWNDVAPVVVIVV